MSFLYTVLTSVLYLFFRLLYRHQVYGIENFPKGPALIVANHTSFWDPPILAAFCPEQVHFLARKSLFRHRCLSWCIQALNAHPISGETEDVAVFHLILDLLKKGKKVVLFPEGTRSLDGTLHPFKLGVSLLADKADVPVIPVYIDAFSVWGRDHKYPKLRGRTACIFGSPLLYKEMSSANLAAPHDKRAKREAFAEKLRATILKLKAAYEEKRVTGPKR